jgi:Putative GTPase activating protein for Arf
MQRQRNQQVLLDHVATELESIRCSNNTYGLSSSFEGKRYNDIGVKFPIGCLQFLKSLPGNNYCVDCGSANPDWASITYGTLMCLQCSGTHRSYGVQVSYVRSIQYDTWNHQQILSMLEGGNTQLRTFFHRHQLLNNNNNNSMYNNNHNYTQPSTTPSANTNCSKSSQQLFDQRYHTKAALFYKVHLKQHVQKVAQDGLYRGREYNRTMCNNDNNKGTTTTDDHRSMSPTTVVVSSNVTTTIQVKHALFLQQEQSCGGSSSLSSCMTNNKNSIAHNNNNCSRRRISLAK